MVMWCAKPSLFLTFKTLKYELWNVPSISNHTLWASKFTFQSTLSRQHLHPCHLVRPVKTFKTLNCTGHILSHCGTLTCAHHQKILLLWIYQGFYQTGVNKQQSCCYECMSDVSADLERAARMRAVAWPAWFWDRWSRKESVGSASMPAFTSSTRTLPGNEVWSSTPKRCSLGNMEEDVTWPADHHDPSLFLFSQINAEPRGAWKV